ncbi:hypothetical protein GH714_043672 [Hevea brasiliensis]|uniref:Methylenetetrahydrofolate reductase n=1 Tax=Hevea brasiliensis TaxID=3981 RepID=A0A6A6K2M2_HEVBR|nr:hypothetical protein GH714_043672 [Hevea brasiliensis]
MMLCLCRGSSGYDRKRWVATPENYQKDLEYLKRKVFLLPVLVNTTEVTAALEPIKDNEEAVRAYGIHLGIEVCKKILAHGIKTLHLYTLNMEKSTLAILMGFSMSNLGLIDESKITRSLPWRRPTNVFRAKEDVRPIFWANRPKSYKSRTLSWEQYPHGRWEDSCNPSYGALTDYQCTITESCYDIISGTEIDIAKYSDAYLGLFFSCII